MSIKPAVFDDRCPRGHPSGIFSFFFVVLFAITNCPEQVFHVRFFTSEILMPFISPIAAAPKGILEHLRKGSLLGLPPDSLMAGRGASVAVIGWRSDQFNEGLL